MPDILPKRPETPQELLARLDRDYSDSRTFKEVMAARDELWECPSGDFSLTDVNASYEDKRTT